MKSHAKIICILTTFLVPFSIILGVAWLHGVNFDHRGPDIGATFVAAFAVSFIISGFSAIFIFTDF